MRNLQQSPFAVEYRDALIQARADRDDRMFESGQEAGVAQAEADLVSMVNQCMRNGPDDESERVRYFIARFVGFLDSWSYDKLSTAIREATGVCKNEDES
ncbi:MAG: hypothetical protein V4801_02540 [Burkholderia gladioli]